MPSQAAVSSPQPANFPRPFIKWAGGKTQMLDQYAALYPQNFTTYHEPFVGSAAVYFHLRGLRLPIRRAWLTDSNDELMNAFRAVRDDVDGLIAKLNRHKRLHSEEHYYAVRAADPRKLSPTSRAARFIYLNKTCYNGLYRVNRKGQFNVPMGRYKNPGIFDADDLRWASQLLRPTKIETAHFSSVLKRAKPGDFVYFDPPYYPLSKTSNFTSYTEFPFGDWEHGELARVFRELDRMECKVMLSNSWTPFVQDLYRGYNIVEVKGSRHINSKPDRRGKISEMVVTNY
jgi:DNA adenine methylase